MQTYQDFVEGGCSVWGAIEEQKGSERYHTAVDAEAYYAKKNITMLKWQKYLYSATGKKVPDIFGANYKLTTLFFRRFVIQQVQYVLSNGVTFEDEGTKDKLGGAAIDNRLVELATRGMIDGVSYGFWNYDHLEVFGFADTPNTPGFVPLLDEDTGELKAGIRYWKLQNKTERATLYEEDGLTEYIRREGEAVQVLEEKKPYIRSVQHSTADGTSITGGRNYGKLPIIPFYANDLRESEICGIRSAIDCYDFIKSGLANTIDDNADMYWVIKNAGGMDDIDLAKFIERMKTVHASVVDDDGGTAVESHTVAIPTEARTKMLDILKEDLYADFQICDVSHIAAGQKTATEIRAAYQAQDDKCGMFEYQLIEFLIQLLNLIGIKDNPTFKWAKTTNLSEETQMVMMAAEVLGDELVLKHLPFLTPEEITERLNELEEDDRERLGANRVFAGQEEEEEVGGEA